MFKKCLVFLLLMLTTSAVFAGVYEAALEKNEKVFLYLHSNNCKYCLNFEPVYSKVSNIYGQKCKFLKVDTETDEGRRLMRLFGARYVPFVVIADSKKQEIYQIEPNCLINFKCTNYYVDRFIRR